MVSLPPFYLVAVHTFDSSTSPFPELGNLTPEAYF
jgi:hypothetical protein